MPIVFDQVEGSVQPDSSEVPRAMATSGNESEAPELDLEKIVRELRAAARRQLRLTAD